MQYSSLTTLVKRCELKVKEAVVKPELQLSLRSSGVQPFRGFSAEVHNLQQGTPWKERRPLQPDTDHYLYPFFMGCLQPALLQWFQVVLTATTVWQRKLVSRMGFITKVYLRRGVGDIWIQFLNSQWFKFLDHSNCFGWRGRTLINVNKRKMMGLNIIGPLQKW